MINQKGFTLVEVLLAAMIVGLIGMALAALTTAAVRESGVGRTRMMLRNQFSIAIRQLREDVMKSKSLSIASGTLTLTLGSGEEAIGPNETGPISYNLTGNTIYRNQGGVQEAWLSNIVAGNSSFASPEFALLPMTGCANINNCVNSILRVRMIVGTDGKPSIKESMEEIIVLPQGFVAKLDQ